MVKFQQHILLFIFCCLALSMSFQSKAKDVIIYPWFDGKFQEDHYYLALLKLALEESKDRFGEYTLVQASQPMFQERSLIEVNKNQKLNVVWSMTSKKREAVLNPIRVPLLRGLGGYRIFLIPEDDQYIYQKIRHADQLKDLVAGQGRGWPDSYILADNGYKLVTPAGHESLFKMLQHGRYAYMPRALHEAWNEAQAFEGLVVESALALQYDSPYFFFVSKKNDPLLQRIEYGLNIAEQKGRFLSLFNSHPVTKDILTKAQLHKRRIFKLNNTFLTPETQKVVSGKKYRLPEL